MNSVFFRYARLIVKNSEVAFELSTAVTGAHTNDAILLHKKDLQKALRIRCHNYLHERLLSMRQSYRQGNITVQFIPNKQ